LQLFISYLGHNVKNKSAGYGIYYKLFMKSSNIIIIVLKPT
jgi:hypothetical protein